MADDPTDASVLRRQLVICNKRGLHARAAAKFVTLAERFGASVEVEKDGQSVSARSIMGLMMLAAGPGSKIIVTVEGQDGHAALDEIDALLKRKFDEE